MGHRNGIMLLDQMIQQALEAWKSKYSPFTNGPAGRTRFPVGPISTTHSEVSKLPRWGGPVRRSRTTVSECMQKHLKPGGQKIELCQQSIGLPPLSRWTYLSQPHRKPVTQVGRAGAPLTACTCLRLASDDLTALAQSNMSQLAAGSATS
jgi:hypothetical protein